MQPTHNWRGGAALRDGDRLHGAVLLEGNLLEGVFRERWLLAAAITYHPARGRGSIGRRRHAAHGYKLFYTNHTGYYYYAARTYTTGPIRYYILTTVQYTLHTRPCPYIPRTRLLIEANMSAFNMRCHY